MKQLAIIVPYYKPDYFRELLDSLARQTSMDFHCYIGDDASSTPAAPILEAYEGKFPFTYHRFETNVGGTSLVQQWARCIAQTQGEPWLAIIGDDDVLSDTYVAAFHRIVPQANDRQIHVLNTAVTIIDEKGTVKRTQKSFDGVRHAADLLVQKFQGERHSSLTEYIFSRKRYEAFGFRAYPLAWSADNMAWMEFSGTTGIMGIQDAQVSFRISSQSISGGNAQRALKHRSKRLFFEDLSRQFETRFTSKQFVFILKKYEVFLVLDKTLQWSQLPFFFKKFVKHGALLEAIKVPLRFLKNRL